MSSKQFAPITRSEDTGANLTLDTDKGTQLLNKRYYTHGQRLKILDFFTKNTSTMYHAERVTGVCRPNICRYVNEMEQQGSLHRVKRELCPISGFRAWYFSTKK